MACTRSQLERMGLPEQATLESLRERLLEVYGERPAGSAALPRRSQAD
jgi:hypothetical protein